MFEKGFYMLKAYQSL